MEIKKGPVRLHVKDISTGVVQAKDLELSIGRLALEEEWEAQGPTPFPGIKSLRAWDHALLARYKPFYAPFCDLCCLCTYGKCDLTGGRRGACGIDIGTQQGRVVLLACCIGAATHTAHARHLLERLLLKYGEDYPINLGSEIECEMPHTRLVCGIKPKTLGDLTYILNYCEEQIVQYMAACHTGQEGNPIDFESKALHMGMIDHVAMEVADVEQIVTFGFPKGDPNAPIAEIGAGVVDVTKPLTLSIGHNVAPSIEIIDYIRKNGLGEPGQIIEVAGLCCTAHDITRYTGEAKIIGPMSYELRYIRSGIADVLVLDEQCIRTDAVEEAWRTNTPVIAANERACYGLPDLTEMPVETIVNKLVNREVKGVAIFDPEKVGVVATLTALRMQPLRKKYKVIPSIKDIKNATSKCTFCSKCRRNCPWDLPTDEAVNAAKHGNIELLAQLYDRCIGCGRCEEACPQKIEVHSLIVAGAERKFRTEKYKVRVGRGPILDTEIREVGAPIVLGEIPGVIAYVGCANWPTPMADVGRMAYEFARRSYIITASGCSAMAISFYKDEEGRSPYEVFGGGFLRGELANVGSCVANPHISDACIKIAYIYARRSLRGNYEEIADYILNRVGACGVAWGAMSQKAASIATGFNRIGVPVILGPQGLKYRRLYLGRIEDVESFKVYDARTGERVFVGPAPEHLVYVAETVEECMVWTAKLCMRPSDTTKGRMIKLTNYVDLYKKFYGKLPEDLPLLVRSEADIPITFKDEIVEFLKAKGWQPHPMPSIDPTLLERLIRIKRV